MTSQPPPWETPIGLRERVLAALLALAEVYEDEFSWDDFGRSARQLMAEVERDWRPDAARVTATEVLRRQMPEHQ